MAYSSIDDPAIYFNTVLYTGNGSTQSVTGVGFQPDWVWNKNRSSARNHYATDSVRGVQKTLRQNSSDAESTNSGGVTAFNSDGFSVGSDNVVNESGDSLVAWNWLAGGSASSNSDGSITSSVSASTTAGFSIVSYTGTGSNATVGHGLGAVPNWIIFKNRETDGQNWIVYHSATSSTPQDDFLKLNDTTAVGTSTSYGNNTAPTTSVFSVGANDNTNKSSEGQIAYCFAEKKGYSKFGSYTGNGNDDGTFVYTGFKPAWVMRKRTDSTNNWGMNDNKRNTFNITEELLLANSSNAASDGTGIDMLSNGFKMRSNSSLHNASGGTYIYMAFAESPFVNSNVVPTNAR